MLMAMMTQMIYEEDPPDRAELDRLLAGIAMGSREALGQLYHRTRGAVYALAVSYLKNPEEAGDVTQDVFVRIWEKADSYRAQGSPMAWILTITRNEARMVLRGRGHVVELDEERWEAIPAEAPSVTPEDRQVLQEAMAGLGDEERKIVLLHAVSGLKHREIAQVLELPLATVLSKYHRTLQKLRNWIKGDVTP